MDRPENQKSDSPPLDYRPAPPRKAGLLSRMLARLDRPLPLGTIYLLVFVLAVVGTLIAVGIAVIVRALR